MSDVTHRPCRDCGVLIALAGRTGRELCLHCARTGLDRTAPTDFPALGYYRSQARLFNAATAATGGPA